MAADATELPEVASVYWRPRLDPWVHCAAASGSGRCTRVAHVLPFLGTAALLIAVQPLAAPLGGHLPGPRVDHPALYAQRGGNVLLPKRAKGARGRAGRRRPARRPGRRTRPATGSPRRAACSSAARSAPGWSAGRRGGRPAGRAPRDCWCVRVAEPDLPSGDRVAHLLLALRADEAGFATVANLAFSGAVWRVRRRTKMPARAALDAAAKSLR